MTSETHPVTQAAPPAADEIAGLEIVARTQGQLIRRRFIRHKAALAGLIMLAFVVVLSISSIGVDLPLLPKIPGWWDKDFQAIGALVDGGTPTLSVVPTFLGGEGIQLGEHPFGQDNIGRDYFALTMRGAQVSLTVAFIVGIVATACGTAVGALAGFFRGWAESVLMRFTDVLIAIPLLAIAAVLARRFGDIGPIPLAIVLGLVIWTGLARLVRGEVLSIREKEFIEAARAAGTRAGRIIVRHILPNLIGVIIVSATLTVAAAILLETALSFLGVGVQPPETSLGNLISQYQTAFTTRPWLFWWPGVFIILIALAVNFIGDGLRDAFDPRQTRVRE
jgi:ABC-type dipeptide/oligopeptide/nickel transport system permease subunit